jgi:hypothetical protein
MIWLRIQEASVQQAAAAAASIIWQQWHVASLLFEEGALGRRRVTWT